MFCFVFLLKFANEILLNKYQRQGLRLLLCSADKMFQVYIMKDPRRESSFWRDPSQGSTRTPLRMQTARGLFSDIQAPGAAESLRGLARPQAVVRGFYKGREQKARLQKQMPWLQGFHWTA